MLLAVQCSAVLVLGQIQGVDSVGHPGLTVASEWLVVEVLKCLWQTFVVLVVPLHLQTSLPHPPQCVTVLLPVVRK